jgi:2-phospho-L-lactate transferase/gluconeogenesis factor (CofD/UPF0052 family)
MPAVTAPTSVLPARLQGPLTDQAIEAVATIADKVEAGEDLTSADAALVMVTFGPAMRELAQWRRKGELVRDLMGDNVMLFPGAR